jgi:hypothetical protein
MSRLCAQEELDEMCRTGIELIHEAIDSGAPAAAAAEFTRVVDVRKGLVDLMIDWSSTTLDHVRETYGPEAMSATFDPDLWLELGLRTGLDLDATVRGRETFADSAPGAAQLAALVEAGERGAAKRLWGEIDDATLKVHDYRIDWLTAVLSHVYREHGAEALSGTLLKSANSDWWHRRMEADLADLADPVSRIRNWSFFLGVGNWGTVSISETDDAFVIHHQVCGSCGRQELRGRYEEPVNFPRIVEPIPGLNFGDTNYTIYRTHLAVWHFVMPIGDVGHPWPAINCSGVPGRCWFTIYKNPHDTPAWYYERAGLEKPVAV